MQVAIITGGSSGIGQSAAIQTARRGVGVIVTYNGRPEGGEETVRTIEGEGGCAVALPLDIGRSETFGAFRDLIVETLESRWGASSFQYLVNNGRAPGSYSFIA